MCVCVFFLAGRSSFKIPENGSCFLLCFVGGVLDSSITMGLAVCKYIIRRDIPNWVGTQEMVAIFTTTVLLCDTSVAVIL